MIKLIRTLMTSLLTLALLVPMLGGVAPTALAASGDFSLDFTASAPYTYLHVENGGGAFNDRTVGKSNDIVESLETGDFACGDWVTFLTQVTVDNTTSAQTDAPQTIELDYSFTGDTTGQSGVALWAFGKVKVNSGEVPNGDNGTGVNVPFVPGYDSGNDPMLPDAAEPYSPTATLVFWDRIGTEFQPKAELVGTVRLSGLDAGHKVVVRMPVRLDCLSGSSPTGNLQASLSAARLVATGSGPVDPPEAIPGGAQTIPFKVTGFVPTAVDVASFTATGGNRAITLQWETASELDNLGFNLYRAESADGPWTQLNTSPIPSNVPPGSPMGAAYTFEDSDVWGGTAYYYRLESIDVQGRSGSYGPVSSALRALKLRPLRQRLRIN